jgi:hypothetical protein
VKHWRFNPDGTFAPFTTINGASRAGSLGSVRSVNGATHVVETVPAAAGRDALSPIPAELPSD